ncbi:MAG: (Fe-S)-binding protein [Euryarchaeota archaeon]|nr:(Fe-S)-binding protein [Euryarchaeota archaeon]
MVRDRYEYQTCPKCHTCIITPEPHYRPLCPIHEEYGFASHSGSGLLKMGRGLLEKHITLEEAAPLAYTCLLCMACHRCPMGAKPSEIALEVRREAWGQGHVPPGLKGAVENVVAHGNPWSQHGGRWSDGIESTPGAKVLYFAGCVSPFRPELKRAARNWAQLLRAAGVEFQVLPEENCCGLPMLQAGAAQEFTQWARDNIERYKGLGVETLVTSCSCCHRVYGQAYPRVAPDGPRVLHASELLLEQARKGALRFQRENGATATLHDSCQSARAMGLTGAPRELLQAAGVRLVEMGRSQGDTWCCGAGGGVLYSDPELALATAHRRLEEAQGSGADCLAVTCPFCLVALGDAAGENPGSPRVVEISDLLVERLA